MAYEAGISYNAGNPSVGEQLIDFYYYRKALIDLKKQQFFGQLADTRAMPKHYGTTIKQYHWIPLLDDRNINDQGIDATGAVVIDEVAIRATNSDGMTLYFVGNGANAAAALTAAESKAQDYFLQIGLTGVYATDKATLVGQGWTFVGDTAAEAYIGSGNLYGSSKDVGTIQGKLPIIGEQGGRINRVGFTRVTLEASIVNFGFFSEYTRDSLNFDNEPELLSHITREAVRAANEIVEDCIQIDLLNGANVVYYGGDATSTNTLTGNTGDTASVLTYDLLVRMDTALTDNRCPKDTEIITGSRMIDTRVVAGARYAYCGSELKRSLLKMVDYHGNQAWIPIEAYGNAGTLATGETGSVASFRFIEVPEMMHWDGAGAAVTTNDGYHQTGGNYDVFPVLIVGNHSFTTIGFQTDGKNVKFEVNHQKPGWITRDDPYGRTGIWSIQWWYGTMILRPEWIGLIKVVAEY